MPELTDTERQMLLLERQWWKHPGSKDAKIRELFGVTPTRYYALLGRLVDRPEALAADPMVVGRLRRIRSERVRSRTRLRA